MEQSSPRREVRLVDPAWSLSELMSRLAKALASDGPAIALSPFDGESIPSRISLIVNTTGSSGNIKEVGLTSSSLLSSAKASNTFVGAKIGDRWSLLLPLNHIAGINVLIRSLELGTIPLDCRNMSHESGGKYATAEFSAIVPTQLFRALHGDSELLEHLRGCRAVLVGGAKLSSELRNQAIASGIKIIETYGSTETTGGCIYDGQPLDGVEIEVSAEGLLRIRGAVLAHSYLNTTEPLVDDHGWYTTSDLAHFEDEKLVIDGRSDDIFISGGENLSLSLVESVISENFPSLEYAAVTIPDAQWGQILCCALVNSEVSNHSEIELGIQEALTNAIGEIAKVKRFLYIDELPLMGIGKVDRAELQSLMGRLIS
jgi:O-succinylbenzoic acid--CoA ligase